MPTSTHWDDDDQDADEEFHDDFDGDFDEQDDFADDDQTAPCPACGEQIYEDAPRCPYCGAYVSEADAPARRRPWWIILTVAVCLYLVYRWTAG